MCLCLYTMGGDFPILSKAGKNTIKKIAWFLIICKSSEKKCKKKFDFQKTTTFFGTFRIYDSRSFYLQNLTTFLFFSTTSCIFKSKEYN